MEKRYKIQRVSGQPVSDEELISDLKNVADKIKHSKLSQREYHSNGHYHESTIIRRFGSWNKALQIAGLGISNEVYLDDLRLFENVFKMWEYYGRQPRRSELAHPPSKISQSPYLRRFRTWTKALQDFIKYANSKERDIVREEQALSEVKAKKHQRDPSLRLRFQVLQRDRFTCRSCGASPAKNLGVELHVDHIIPYSKGGQTIIDNLQTLCDRCNLGKGNMHK